MSQPASEDRPVTAADVRLEVAAMRARPTGAVEVDLRQAVRAVRIARRELQTRALELARLVDRAAGAHGEAFALEAVQMTETELLELCRAPGGLQAA